jgi:hypothetical protein
MISNEKACRPLNFADVVSGNEKVTEDDVDKNSASPSEGEITTDSKQASDTPVAVFTHQRFACLPSSSSDSAASVEGVVLGEGAKGCIERTSKL